MMRDMRRYMYVKLRAVAALGAGRDSCSSLAGVKQSRQQGAGGAKGGL